MRPADELEEQQRVGRPQQYGAQLAAGVAARGAVEQQPATRNARAFVTDMTKTVRRTDAPPISDANACCAVAIGP